MPDVPNFSEESVPRVVSMLERDAIRIRLYGLLALIATLANLLVFVYTVLFLYSRDLSLILGASCASVIVLLALYEQRRKSADALFEELSEELHWDLRGSKADISYSSAEQFAKPLLQARIVLRQYSRASDLPLIPGKLGPAGYVAVNLVLLLTDLLLGRVTKALF